MRTRRVLAVLAGLWLAVLTVAPAAAHGGKLKLVVAGDGATGVTVQASHADGHPLTEPVRLVLTAAGADGRKVGPVQLVPSVEGEGFYSSGPLLSPGRWKVTVTAPAPTAARATAQVDARPAAVPVPAGQQVDGQRPAGSPSPSGPAGKPAAGGATGGASDPATGRASGATGGPATGAGAENRAAAGDAGRPWWPIAVAVPVLAVLALLGVLAARRTRQPDNPGPGPGDPTT
ncbi:hypothetical protein K7640_19745 [Micromonospora sp. PLK6-60]|uniref:hypothetical protein n=1 Tax=Micromonospora sp. PLK6-60 TaxID=2873383 RepID=UPI001CA6F907|nr:hypothetical protein [Micromonospora sp. PLK6-60]MBY8874063.1 hypothetical protein [Micromonospora sp. PLK6-60]